MNIRGFCTAFFVAFGAAAAPPLATLEYKLAGVRLDVSPAVLSVPKNIAGSIAVNINGGVTFPGAFVEATLRGPSFPARRLVGEAGKALVLPPLALVGDYSLDNIQLIDGATGATILEGTPATVPVHVFDEVLVSRVNSRPLSLEEIRGKGIVIDESNFRAVEFEVGFVLDGKTIPVKFPVVAPKFDQSTEIIPRAELQAKLAKAQEINDALGGVHDRRTRRFASMVGRFWQPTKMAGCGFGRRQNSPASARRQP